MTAALSGDIADNLIDSLQALINKILGMDEETLQALGQLSGKVIFIDIHNSDLHFHISFHPEGVQIKSGICDAPDVHIKTHLGSLIAMLFAKKIAAIPEDMEIIGNVNLIRKFQNIMLEFDPDWEEPASRLLGDTITCKLSRLIKNAGKYGLDNTRHVMTEISEYMRFEKNIVPDATEIEDFNKEVTELRSATDIIEKRIKKLEAANNQGKMK